MGFVDGYLEMQSRSVSDVSTRVEFFVHRSMQ
jgi:hypothetical protein